MKKPYSWQVLLILFAIYLILVAFFPGLNLIFNYFRLTLLLALAFLWLGVERKNTILFFIGLSFSSLYMREIIPYSYTTFNVGPLFFGILVLGIAIHSINKKRNQDKLLQFETASTATIHSSATNYLNIEANFTDKYEYSTAPALQAISIKTFFANVQVDLSEAQFEKDMTHLIMKNTVSNCRIRIPKNVTIVNNLKSGLGELYLPPTPQATTHQLYLTGTNTLGTITIQYAE
ncbi:MULTISPECIES: LiaF domain-containing protein [unclassified Streptococcus]|uniref:LiaF domain-containing protein n=1 Tax=unclassified Streptococcus TaxID=2608887 RepID=UPI001072C91C|nr:MULTISPECIES: LiaF domain-containing protein [unclassified Streptococcus]MBF0787928.1 hypothetical protein [Streptococcus sp. 19428wC2_LYSM12]MCQ9211292.1 cell wall-active antibiotics response protein [Streptococcus sp. B01]MCQ9214604.1 cell wall-active antibiotics response protein [Streptococcus sp. O1]TFV05048.1 hypothetical protein E4T79_08570 [Streptococcus sp. LYSM12]